MMEWLDYRQLPPAAGGFSELFYDYLYEYDKVRQYFPSDFRENESFESVMKGIDDARIDRTLLQQVLAAQNSTGGESARTTENVRLLGKKGSYAVVTGQQVGLFGGPLYTLYKAITAVGLAQKLTLKFPGKNFVPVFWIEGEDHDFQEMNHIVVLDGENVPVRIEYLPGGVMPEKNVGAVGEMVFDDAITGTIDRLESSLARSEYTPALIASLRENYAPGATFNRAFQAWMNRMLPGSGIVFLYPGEPRLKKLLSPLFVRELREFPRISQMVIQRSAELERRYHAQIKTKS
ncbi:MAG TPA: bacillithiol biosynthesis BshC, partial [Bacteroidota bacterium]|nr:bacillithiol biosynthesis BshC [Bacteroidota bacterium]